MLHVNMISGGGPSWAAGKWVAKHHGTDRLIHLFADTLWEDADLYRFLPEAVANIGGKLVRLCEGRAPWELFRDAGMIGNTRADLCSRALKREPLARWCEANCDPADTTFYIGYLWFERKRFEGGRGKPGLRERMAAKGWRYEAPLIYEPQPLSKADILAWMEREGLTPPVLYDEGFPNNNCAGRCVKQGQAGWAHLLKVRPESFAEVERLENEQRARLGKDVAMLRDRRGGKTVALPLTVLRERIERGEGCARLDFGEPCQCLFPDQEEQDHA